MKKKILLLNYEFPPLGGGAGNATYYILKEFSKNPNIEVDLVTSSIDMKKIEKFSDNITIHYLDVRKKRLNLHFQKHRNLIVYSIKAYFYANKLIKKKNFDICHAFFGIPCGFLAMIFKRRYRIPYIVSLRGSDVPGYNKRFYFLDQIFLKRLSKKIWREAKYVVANSEGLKELAKETNSEQKISVVYNGIDIYDFIEKKQIRKKEGEELILVSTGRLIERKGYNYLIEAISGIKDVELWLIGSGDGEKSLSEKAEKLNANVKFFGKRHHNEIGDFLRKSDIFVLPSLNEGMSNSILEAMACGLPIITTDTGGSKELIQGNGFIVKKKNSKDLKKYILKYLEDRDLIIKHGENSRKVAEKMGWDNVAKDYLRLY